MKQHAGRRMFPGMKDMSDMTPGERKRLLEGGEKPVAKRLKQSCPRGLPAYIEEDIREAIEKATKERAEKKQAKMERDEKKKKKERAEKRRMSMMKKEEEAKRIGTPNPLLVKQKDEKPCAVVVKRELRTKTASTEHETQGRPKRHQRAVVTKPLGTMSPSVKQEEKSSTVVIKKEPMATSTHSSTPPPKALKSADQLEPSPFPKLNRPLPTECIRARDALAALHGAPSREKLEKSGTILEKHETNHRTILDSLVRTILSQNTTDSLSSQAFASFKAKYPTYKAMLEAPVANVEESIRIGGLAAIKVGRIRAILNTILEERPQDCIKGEPSLEYIWSMDTEAIKAELGRFKGVGPKTISCVLMFTMQRDEFPVDTHVWHIAKRLGWVPNSASREQAYLHLNRRVPDHVKYDLHVLLVKHGKRCTSCAKGGRLIQPSDGPCPLKPAAIKEEGTVKVKVEKS